MKFTVLGKKVTGIIMAAMIAVSAAAVSISADTTAEPEAPAAIAREVSEQKWELTDPTSITDANATAGGNMRLMVTFTEAFEEGYEIQINFTTASGVTKTYTASTQVPPMKTNYSCIPIRDMFDKLHLGGQELTSVTFTGKSAGEITSISYINGKVMSLPAAPAKTASAAETKAPAAETITKHASDKTSASAAAPAADTTLQHADKNPSTGVEDLTVPLALTCFCGVAVILSMNTRKRR